MFTLEKTRAEAQLAASQMKTARLQEEREVRRQAQSEKVSRLRALRRAKEAADKKT